MKQFTSHIDFLLQKHDCVIIPDFGGFVLNREQAIIIPDGAIRPPFVVVGFNPDLKYNDGLLAESFMNVYSLSYDAACKRVREYVDKIYNTLNSGQSVQIGRLGRLKLDDSKQLTFVPNHYLSLYYPETYGLSLARVRRLSDIPDYKAPTEQSSINKRRTISLKNIAIGTAAAAAAVLVFFASSTPVLQKEKGQIQQSGFFTTTIPTTIVDLKSENQENNLLNEKASIDETLITNKKQEVSPKVIKTKPKEVELSNKPVKSGLTYYIVIASAISKVEADNLLTKLKAQGYTKSELIMSHNNRYRISVSSFAEKEKAEKFLSDFRKDNPKFNDAWVYSKKI